MALLSNALNDKQVDVRFLNRSIAKGSMAQEDADKAARKLPDDSENAEYININTLIESLVGGGRASLRAPQ